MLGDAHVDRATAAITDLNRDFQDLITRYAWGEIWSRPGLDRKTRSCMVLSAMIALGQWDEFRLHMRAAFNNGLTESEIKEVILQAAIYCGVPAANHAFREAAEVIAERKAETAPRDELRLRELAGGAREGWLETCGDVADVVADRRESAAGARAIPKSLVACPLYLTARGLTTSPMPDGGRTFQIDFDLIDHLLAITTSDGDGEVIRLAPGTVADFYAEFMQRLQRLGLVIPIWPKPVEMATAIPFPQDDAASPLPAGGRRAPVPHCRNCRYRVEAILRRLSRQGQSDALLLGQLRSRHDAVLRPQGARASWRRPKPCRPDHARGLFA